MCSDVSSSLSGHVETGAWGGDTKAETLPTSIAVASKLLTATNIHETVEVYFLTCKYGKTSDPSVFDSLGYEDEILKKKK